MASGLKITGVKRFEESLSELNKKMRMAGYRITLEGAQVITKNSRRQFTTVAISTKTGEERVIAPGSKLQKGEKLSRYGRHVEGSQPHIRSGYLARSISFDGPREVGYGRWETKTGPKAAYGRRIELGFTGRDSLGRNYDQPPFPYMRPGFEDSKPEIEAIAQREWAKAVA